MGFELRAHTADVGVAVRGNSLEAVFASAGEGLAAAMCDDWPDAGSRFPIEVESESIESLLFDYLDELIYQRDVRNVLPVDHEVSIMEYEGGWKIHGRARGVPLSEIDAREVKAVTYSDMRLEKTVEGWEAYVVFDV